MCDSHAESEPCRRHPQFANSSSNNNRNSSIGGESNDVNLPLDMLSTKIMPYLDRSSWNNFSMTCKEVHRASQSQALTPPPWPRQINAKVNRLCRVTCMDITSDSGHIACGYSDGRIRLWGRRCGEITPSIHGHWPEESVCAMVFSWNSELLATAGFDHVINLWDLRGGLRAAKPSATFYAPFVSSMCFSNDDAIVASAHQNSTVINLWSVATRQCVQSLDGFSSGMTSLSFSFDGMSMIGTTGLDIYEWSLEDESCQSVEDGVFNTIASLPNGNHVAAIDAAQRVAVWNTANGWSKKHELGIRGKEALMSNRSSKLVVLDENHQFHVWNLDNSSDVARKDIDGRANDTDRASGGDHDDDDDSQNGINGDADEFRLRKIMSINNRRLSGCRRLRLSNDGTLIMGVHGMEQCIRLSYI